MSVGDKNVLKDNAQDKVAGGGGKILVLRYRGTYRRERNLLALLTLDMYLPLSKFESIQRVSIDATV